MGSVLVIKLSALGDLVQADGAVRDIREHHANDRLTIMTTPAYRRFMERCPWVDEVFVDPRASRFNFGQMLRLRRRLQRSRFEHVYDLQQVGRTRFYYRWLFPSTQWLGDARGCRFYLKRIEETTCAADHFHRQLKMAGINVQHTLNTDVSWMADNVDHVLAKSDLEAGFVVLIPGASASHEVKRWPYFKELALRLQEYGKRVVTIPGPAEMELCRIIPGTMLVPEKGYFDFFALAGIVKKSGFVVGNDTGPTHIAAHAGCSGLALFGSHTTPATTGIQHTRFAVMEKNNLADLTLDQVWAHIVPEL